MKYALGVDIGGTKTSLTLGNSSGRIVSKETLPTLTGAKARHGIEQIAEGLGRLGARVGPARKILGVGVGVPGPMNPHTGVVERSPHLKGWQGFPLKSFLRKRLRLPIYLTNDANAAAVGEKMFGGGRHVENFVYLTLSTGIGGGIVFGGKLLTGATFGAGEVGHTIIVAGGDRCGCGQKGCLEAYASGTAIAHFVQKEIKRGRKSKIRRLVRTNRRITAEIVALAAAEGDALALESFRRAGFFLGVGLANLINLLNPEKLILGGSVMKSSRLLWKSMMASVRRHAWSSLFRGCQIEKTGLGDRVGDLGALALVFAASGRGRSAL